MAESTSVTCEAFGVDDDPLHWVRLARVWVTVRLQVHADLQGTVCQRAGPQPEWTGREGLYLLLGTHHLPTLTSSMMDSGHRVTCKSPLCCTQQQGKVLAAAGTTLLPAPALPCPSQPPGT